MPVPGALTCVHTACDPLVSRTDLVRTFALVFSVSGFGPELRLGRGRGVLSVSLLWLMEGTPVPLHQGWRVWSSAEWPADLQSTRCLPHLPALPPDRLPGSLYLERK